MKREGTEYSFNNYKNKNIRDTSISNSKNIIIKIFAIILISTIIFFVICFFMDSPSEEVSTPEECRAICNGSFSLSNGKCVCSYQ